MYLLRVQDDAKTDANNLIVLSTTFKKHLNGGPFIMPKPTEKQTG
jgi:hypothetical protein